MQPIVILAGSLQIIKLHSDLIVSIENYVTCELIEQHCTTFAAIAALFTKSIYILNHICLFHCSDIDVPVIDNKAEIVAPTATYVEL